MFSHLKLESEGGMEEAIVDNSGLESGLVYEGMVTDDTTQNYSARAVDGSISGKTKLSYTFRAFEEKENGVELNGTLAFKAGINLEYYISESYSRFEIKVSPEASFNIEFECKLSTADSAIEVPLCPITLPFLGGAVTVKFTPALVAELAASVSVQIGKLKATVGFYFDTGANGTSFKPIYSSSYETIQCEAEGSLFFGLSLKPSVGILGKVAEASIKGKLGVRLTAKPTTRELDSEADVIHACDGCFDGDISLAVSTSASLELFGKSWLTNNISFFDVSWKFADYYFCYEHGEFAFGVCPYQKYRTTVVVTNAEGKPLSNVTVTVGDEEKKTDDKGIAVFYLLYMEHEVTAAQDGLTVTKTIMANEAQKVVLRLCQSGESINILGNIVCGKVMDDGSAVATGKCGESAYWTLYSDGCIVISGTGEMWDFTNIENPWEKYKENIYSITIEEGITSIGMYAFSDCTKLTNINIAYSVVKIGDASFGYCSSITEINIPDGVQIIGMSAFVNCKKLKTVFIPTSVETIEMFAFYLSGLNDVYYAGTEEQWKNISIGDYANLNKTIHYNSALEKTEDIGKTMNQEDQLIAFSVYPGEYFTEPKEAYALKTAIFQNLLPEQSMFS